MAQTTEGGPGERTYRCRFMESGAECAIGENGHYYVLRCGDLVQGVRVRLKLPGLTHRQGTLMTLLLGLGPSPRPIIGVVALDPPKTGDPMIRALPVVRHYRVEQLELIT